MNNLDKYMKLNILSFLYVTELIEKKVISTEFEDICKTAIKQKVPWDGPIKFDSLINLRHYVIKYINSKNPLDIEYIASKYGYPIGK